MATTGHDTIPAGYVRRAHGIRGDVVVRGMLVDAGNRLVPGASFTSNEDRPRILTIAEVSPLGDDYKIRFEGIDDRNAADALRGIQLLIDAADRRVLEAGEWWPEDLVGCSVLDMAGEVVGEVAEVILAGVQDRLMVVRPDGTRAEVPFVEALVPQVDPDARTVTVDLPGGLFD